MTDRALTFAFVSLPFWIWPLALPLALPLVLPLAFAFDFAAKGQMISDSGSAVGVADELGEKRYCNSRRLGYGIFIKITVYTHHTG